ncbi:imm11 family protein [Myxococcus sp. CA051A]|uniref:imm11 family protein n=1 Tax=Myxococcus sp. CA051A TaxID=2741739 RepID=UPI0020C64588|nr:DUF1629 domain-containing protein [Myxococcus sp. CA051A]
MAFRKGLQVDVSVPVRLRLGEPVPQHPRMVDFHSLPAPVVSQRLADVLRETALPGVQLVPADVEVAEGDTRRYWLVHMWRRLACVDMARSSVTLYPSGGILDIESLVLDEAVLQETPLEERMVFRVREVVLHLVHRTVMERVLALAPPVEGIRFVPVPEWSDGRAFR